MLCDLEYAIVCLSCPCSRSELKLCYIARRAPGTRRDPGVVHAYPRTPLNACRAYPPTKLPHVVVVNLIWLEFVWYHSCHYIIIVPPGLLLTGRFLFGDKHVVGNLSTSPALSPRHLGHAAVLVPLVPVFDLVLDVLAVSLVLFASVDEEFRAVAGTSEVSL
jgi:hypothetical protein